MHTYTVGCYRLIQVALLVVVGLRATPAFGAPILFNDRASFAAAVGPDSLMTFDEPITCSELRVEVGTCRANVDKAAFEFESFFYGSSFVDVVPIREWSASLTFDRPVPRHGTRPARPVRQPLLHFDSDLESTLGFTVLHLLG